MACIPSFAVTLFVAAGAGAAPAFAVSPGIGVSAPRYESPGGTVPTIVTAYGVRRGFEATITARGTRGAIATCTGPVWINRVRETASRKCYLRLPLRTGSYGLSGRAQITRDGVLAATRTGVSSRPVLASGFRSSRPMTLERIEQIERCANDTDRVWLTFDDGGSPAQVRRILATLARNGVRGRFFFTGAWAAQNGRLLDRMRSEGHVIGNHSWTHAALSAVPGAEVFRQLARGTAATGAPKLLRPPFGAGAFSDRLRTLAAARGYELCRWTVDTYDWQGPTAARMAERVARGDEMTPPVGPGGNILMHGTGRFTSGGLQQIIDAVKRKGLELDPLS